MRGQGEYPEGPKQALFQKVQGGNVSFSMRNPGTGAALGAAPGAGSSLSLGRQRAGLRRTWPLTAGPARPPRHFNSSSPASYGNRFHFSLPAKATPPRHKKNPSHPKSPSTTSALCRDGAPRPPQLQLGDGGRVLLPRGSSEDLFRNSCLFEIVHHLSRLCLNLINVRKDQGIQHFKAHTLGGNHPLSQYP
ncbi:unnamed protein product [Coccothraustes coccothraustes]